MVRAGHARAVDEALLFDGRRCNLLSAKFPLRDRTGAIIAVVDTSTDMTERKLAEACDCTVVTRRTGLLAMRSYEMLNNLLRATRTSRGKVKSRMENVELVTLRNKALEGGRALLETEALRLHGEGRYQGRCSP